MSSAASMPPQQYLKEDYLQIVEDLNLQYGSKIILEFETPGPYISSNEIPSPSEYKKQLVELLEEQKAVKLNVEMARRNGSSTSNIMPFAASETKNGSADVASSFFGYNIGIDYTAVNTIRWFFQSCNKVWVKHSLLFPEYTYTVASSGSSLLDLNRTIYAWTNGVGIYATGSYRQVFQDLTLAAEFYIDAAGKVTAKRK